MLDGGKEFERTGSQFPPMVKLKEPGATVQGTFLGVGEGEKKTKEGSKKFPILKLRVNGTGTEVGIPMAGHLRHLVDEAKLTAGDYIRVTFLEWDEMEDGNKVRHFLLEKAKS